MSGPQALGMYAGRPGTDPAYVLGGLGLAVLGLLGFVVARRVRRPAA